MHILFSISTGHDEHVGHVYQTSLVTLSEDSALVCVCSFFPFFGGVHILWCLYCLLYYWLISWFVSFITLKPYWLLSYVILSMDCLSYHSLSCLLNHAFLYFFVVSFHVFVSSQNFQVPRQMGNSANYNGYITTFFLGSYEVRPPQL